MDSNENWSILFPSLSLFTLSLSNSLSVCVTSDWLARYIAFTTAIIIFTK